MLFKISYFFTYIYVIIFFANLSDIYSKNLPSSCEKIFVEFIDSKLSLAHPNLKKIKFKPSKVPGNLSELRKAIKDKGLFTVLYGGLPRSQKDIENDELINGTKIIYSFQYSKDRLTMFEGVALHPGDYRNYTDHITGEINPHLNENQWKLGKWEEYLLFSKSVPSSMPDTLLGMEFIKNNSFLEEERKFLASKFAIGENGNEKRLLDFLRKIFNVSKKKYGKAYFKLKNEYQTGDRETTITTFESNPEDLVDIFIKDFRKAKKHISNKQLSIRQIMSKSENRETQLLYSILYHPENFIIQKALEVAYTDFGYPYEVRVDVLAGIPIRAIFRHSHEFLSPHKQEEALNFVKNLMKNLPDDYKQISGGMDVMFLKDGSLKLIESNAGSNSGFIIGEFTPVETNMFVSILQGKPTPLIKLFEDIYSSPIETQLNFFETLDEHPVIDNSYFLTNSIFIWFRNKYLNDFLSNPTYENGKIILSNLKKILKAIEDNEDVHEIYESAKTVILDRSI